MTNIETIRVHVRTTETQATESALRQLEALENAITQGKRDISSSHTHGADIAMRLLTNVGMVANRLAEMDRARGAVEALDLLTT